MISCGEYAVILERAAARVPAELLIGTKKLVKAVAIEAQSYIGHYQAGWAPLSKGTLEGGVSKSGHRYKGKIALGYAPPDNPLLRTGHMQATIEGRAEAMGTGAIGVVGSNNIIAKFQELGTRDMPPRPFLGLAMSRATPTIEIIFNEIAANILRGAP